MMASDESIISVQGRSYSRGVARTIEAEGTRYEWLMPKEEGAEAIRMRSMSDRDACVSPSRWHWPCL
jgi:hypothetical protein